MRETTQQKKRADCSVCGCPLSDHSLKELRQCIDDQAKRERDTLRELIDANERQILESRLR